MLPCLTLWEVNICNYLAKEFKINLFLCQGLPHASTQMYLTDIMRGRSHVQKNTHDIIIFGLPSWRLQSRTRLPMQESWGARVRDLRGLGSILGLGRSPGGGMITHRYYSWRIPWAEKLGGLQSIGSHSRTWLKRLGPHVHMILFN